MAIHLGLLRAGWRGLLVAGTCFILPAMTITLTLAWAYVRYGALPQVSWLLYGVKPVIIAIVFQALWGFATKAVKDPVTGVVGAVVLALSFLGWDEVLLLLVGGIVVMLATPFRRKGAQTVIGRGRLQLDSCGWVRRRPPRAWLPAQARR